MIKKAAAVAAAAGGPSLTGAGANAPAKGCGHTVTAFGATDFADGTACPGDRGRIPNA